jgi:arylsulfatase A-like enzyme
MYDHIILISIDTLRADGIAANPLRLWPQEYDLSYELRTPVLDELAGKGAFFANAITAAPYTSASHASLLTGLWPPRHGAREFFGSRLSAPTLFTWAKRQGYSTILKTDFPVMLGAPLGFVTDVDRYLVEDDDAFLRALSEAGRSCSLLHFGSVHIPYGFHNMRFGGGDYLDKVEELEAEVGQGGGIAAPDVLSETYRTAEDLDLLLRYKRAIVALYAERRYDRLFTLYLEGIERFCRTRLGPVLDRLREATADKRTLFVLFGDHGEAYNDETYGHFNSVDEGVLRVPLLFWGDGVEPGLFTSRVRTIDLIPTLYDLLGWDVAADDLDGTSLAEAVRGGNPPGPYRAHSQAFVARADQAFRAQRQFYAGDEMEQVQHVLYKEAVYEGDYKLTRRHFVVGSENRDPIECTPELRLQRFDGELRLHDAYDAGATENLLKLMSDYGRLGAVAARNSTIPSEMLRHLQNHGYFGDGD